MESAIYFMKLSFGHALEEVVQYECLTAERRRWFDSLVFCLYGGIGVVSVSSSHLCPEVLNPVTFDL